MPKRRPNEVTSGKGKASKPQQPGQNRLATLVAAALSNDEDILEEISSLLLAKLSKQDGREGPKTRASLGPNPTSHTPSCVTSELASLKEQLLEASLAPSTRAVYSKSWTKFKDFHANFASHQPVLPLSVDLITSFVAHLFKQGLSPSTINSNLSVISYFHSHSGFPDPCANTQVRRMTLGCRKLKQHVDTRLPLHTHITLLIQGVASLYQSSPYLQKLYCAIILLAFFVFFLIGELLPLSPHLSSAVVQRQHVTVSPTFLRLHLHNYKTQKTDKPLTILIKSQSPLCPVKALQAYFLVRGTKMAHYSCLPFHHQFQLRSFGPFSMNFLFTLTFPKYL
ncbi:uncharacterized protein LOC128232064 [Mya arenaria]|uniref:uncharacterized protein LOC128232064 n=1 Tax=Mya arenaria TaxID=6604 RepID=UPI0022E873F9|nr:uncharacterized protein LOC128232064 [Mya arenaria]